MVTTKRQQVIAIVLVILLTVLFEIFTISHLVVQKVTKTKQQQNQAEPFASVGEIYNSPANMRQLYNLITGHAGATYDEIVQLAAQTTTAADIRAHKYQKRAGQDVVVYLGGRAWHVCYLSLSNDLRPILTLMLRDSLDVSQWNNMLYNAFWQDTYPCNLYGVSYLRVVTLNNAGEYSDNRMTLKTGEPQADHALAKFTMDTVDDNYCAAIVAPWQMLWQAAGQNAQQLGLKYKCPNENLSPETDLNHWSTKDDVNLSTITAHHIYAAWYSDRVWLPSLSEVGHDAQHAGLWQLSTAQRANQYGRNWYTWLRSASCYDTGEVLALSNSGDSVAAFAVTEQFGVRPALHLDLSQPQLAASFVTNLSVSYTGRDQRIENMKKKPDWYEQGMTFTYRQNGTVVDEVKDPGSYRVTVQRAGANADDQAEFVLTIEQPVTKPKRPFRLLPLGLTISAAFLIAGIVILAKLYWPKRPS